MLPAQGVGRIIRDSIRFLIRWICFSASVLKPKMLKLMGRLTSQVQCYTALNQLLRIEAFVATNAR